VSWLPDTDVICQPAKRNGDTKVITWIEQALHAWLTRLVDAWHGRIHGFHFRRPGLRVFNPFKELASGTCWPMRTQGVRS
jgi:hypothetical protein